jgi:hypothetical protein
MRQYNGRFYLGEHASKSTQICTCALCEDPATKTWAEAFNSGLNTSPDVNDLLLAPRVLGYTLGKKLWCQFRIDCIKNVTDYGNPGLGQEMIPPENMSSGEWDDIIQMVQCHSAAMAHPQDERFSDVVPEKGESLILLFHGE